MQTTMRTTNLFTLGILSIFYNKLQELQGSFFMCILMIKNKQTETKDCKSWLKLKIRRSLDTFKLKEPMFPFPRHNKVLWLLIYWENHRHARWIHQISMKLLRRCMHSIQWIAFIALFLQLGSILKDPTIHLVLISQSG